MLIHAITTSVVNCNYIIETKFESSLCKDIVPYFDQDCNILNLYIFYFRQTAHCLDDTHHKYDGMMSKLVCTEIKYVI